MRLLSLLVLAWALFVPPAAQAAASAWQENEHGRVRLITPYRVAPSTGPDSGEFPLGIEFHTAPGWHVYWKNSGDAGFPPKVAVLEPAELGPAELLWPAPDRFELPGDLVAFGYEGEVVYPLRVRLEAAGKDRVRIAVDVDYLTCEVDCVPYRYTLALEQPLGATVEDDPETAPLLDRWWRRVPSPAGARPGVTTDATLLAEGPALEVRVRGAEPGPGTGLFLEANETYDAGRPEVRKVPGGAAIRVPLRPRREDQAPPAAVPFAWTVTGLASGGETFALEARAELSTTAPPAPGAAPGRALPRAVGVPWPAALLALFAVAALIGTLALWGLFGPPAASAGPATQYREALGFLFLALALAALYALSYRVSAEGLAVVELMLLATSLLAWLRRRAGGRRRLAAALALAAVLAAAAVPWIAESHRLEAARAGGSSGFPFANDDRGDDPPAARTTTGG